MQFKSDPTPEAEAVPLARIILDTRMYQRLAGFMAVSLCLSTLALYLVQIYPAFLPADYTNPAAVNFMTSATYKERTKDLFVQLETYNRRSHEGVNPPFDFFAVDPSQFGLVVTLAHRLVPWIEAPRLDGRLPQFRYDNTITVRPALPTLILFCLFETFLIALAVYIFTQRPPDPKLAWEEQILRDYFTPHEQESPANAWRGHAAAIAVILGNFHACCAQLNRRYGGRQGLPINDEYDVQDVLHALLKLHFHDIRPEEPTPSYVGSSTRMDFLLYGTGIVVEAKITRPGRADKQIGAELLLDVAHYAAHQSCALLVCFIYDPGNHIVNAAALQTDLARHAGRLRVDVIVSPAQ